MNLNTTENEIKDYVKIRFLRIHPETSDGEFGELWNEYKEIPEFKINENVFDVKELKYIHDLIKEFYKNKINEIINNKDLFKEYIGYYKKDEKWGELKFIKDIVRTPIVYLIDCKYGLYIGAHILETRNEMNYIQLLKQYNSSSSFKYLFNDNDCEYIILKTFDTYQDAINFESFLHNILDVKNSKIFYNKNNQQIFYNSVNFNATPVLLVDEELNIIEKYPSQEATPFSCSRVKGNLYNKTTPIIKNNKKCKIILEEDYLNLNKEDYDMSKFWYDNKKDSPRNKKCFSIDCDTFEIEEFNSLSEAVEKYNNGSISTAIKKIEVYKCENKIWFDEDEFNYYNDSEKLMEIVKNYCYMSSYIYQKHIKVYQYNENGELINVYNGTKEAEEKTSVPMKRIISALNGRQLTAGGFYWKSEEKNSTYDKLFNNKILNVKLEKFIKLGYIHDHGSLDGFWEARRIYDKAPDFKADENIFEVYPEWNDYAHSIMKYTTGFFMKLTFHSMKIDINDPNIQMDFKNGNIGSFNRIAKVFCGYDTHDDTELGSGRWMRPIRLAKFPNTSKERIPITKEVTLVSNCSHHFISFNSLSDSNSKVIISYIPDKFVLGISKLSRLVNYISRRFYLQEDLTRKIYEAISEAAETKDVYVGMFNIVHGCERLRGSQDNNGKFTTEYYGGAFEDPEVRKQVNR